MKIIWDVVYEHDKGDVIEYHVRWLGGDVKSVPQPGPDGQELLVERFIGEKTVDEDNHTFPKGFSKEQLKAALDGILLKYTDYEPLTF